MSLRAEPLNHAVQGAERIRTAVSGVGTLYMYLFRAAGREAAQAREGAGS